MSRGLEDLDEGIGGLGFGVWGGGGEGGEGGIRGCCGLFVTMDASPLPAKTKQPHSPGQTLNPKPKAPKTLHPLNPKPETLNPKP